MNFKHNFISNQRSVYLMMSLNKTPRSKRKWYIQNHITKNKENSIQTLNQQELKSEITNFRAIKNLLQQVDVT